MVVKLYVNGSSMDLDVDPKVPLLYILRNDLALNSPRFGCGLGQCGACSVLVDGVSMRSCMTPVESVLGRKVTTVEGLGSREGPHPLQEAFIDEQAMQCGYCSSGIIISAAALLERQHNPSEQEIRRALAGHICRCGVHTRMIRAIRRATEKIHSAKPS